MVSNLPRAMQKAFYLREALAYLRRLPLGHFLESTAQGQQRKITLESFDLVQTRRPDVHVFNELLVKYPVRGKSKLGQDVPEIMVVLSEQTIEAKSSYNVPLEPAEPFWVFEYVSLNMYERVEGALLSHLSPGRAEASPAQRPPLRCRHGQQAWPAASTGAGHGIRLARRLVRYWRKCKLLPLPADMQAELNQAHNTISDMQVSAHGTFT